MHCISKIENLLCKSNCYMPLHKDWALLMSVLVLQMPDSAVQNFQIHLCMWGFYSNYFNIDLDDTVLKHLREELGTNSTFHPHIISLSLSTIVSAPNSVSGFSNTASQSFKLHTFNSPNLQLHAIIHADAYAITFFKSLLPSVPHYSLSLRWSPTLPLRSSKFWIEEFLLPSIRYTHPYGKIPALFFSILWLLLIINISQCTDTVICHLHIPDKHHSKSVCLPSRSHRRLVEIKWATDRVRRFIAFLKACQAFFELCNFKSFLRFSLLFFIGSFIFHHTTPIVALFMIFKSIMCRFFALKW